MKYRSLSFTINNSNPKNLVFTVRIGMLEASFDAKNGLKKSGSLGGDERIVTQWFLFGNNQEALAKYSK